MLKNTLSTKYADSIYVFLILLTHSTIWKEQGFQTQKKNNSITNSSYTHDLIKASLLFSQNGWVHCKAHETDHSIVNKGNNYTNTASYQAAFISPRTHQMSLLPTLLHNPENNLPNPPSTQDIICYLHQIFHTYTKSVQSFSQNHFILTPPDKTFFNRT